MSRLDDVGEVCVCMCVEGQRGSHRGDAPTSTGHAPRLIAALDMDAHARVHLRMNEDEPRRATLSAWPGPTPPP